MADRTSRTLLVLALGVVPLASLPLAASAQTSVFYSPPKVVKQGTNATPIAGSGTVRVQVFVNANGSVGATKIQRSTNPKDNAAALEIAKTSRYKAGARDAKPVGAFYTMDLKFNGTQVVNDTGSTSSAVTTANTLIRSGNYAQAKSQLNTYLASHPTDGNAQALLGVADSFTNDAAGAAAAFDKAGTVPANFKTVAVKAYSDAAADALKNKQADQAAAYAQKSIALQPTANAYYVEGIAYANAQQYDKSQSALEQAKTLAQSGHADAATLNAIDTQLVSAYLLGGQEQKGLTLAQDLKRRDPSANVDVAVAAYYNQQAQAAAKSGNTAAAVAAYENGAKTSPANASVLYTNAAQMLAQNAKSKDDWTKVKAETDKALAANPNSAPANYLAGIALGNSGDLAGAKAALQKAKANVGSDAQLSAQIDAQLANLAKLGQK